MVGVHACKEVRSMVVICVEGGGEGDNDVRGGEECCAGDEGGGVIQLCL